MAAYAIHNYDSSLSQDAIDPSQANYSSIDDFFGVDPQNFVNDHSTRQDTSLSYPYDSLSQTSHDAPQRTASAGVPMNGSLSSDGFAYPQRPQIWLDPTPGQKGALCDLDNEFDTSAVTDSHVDYGFLAGSNNGLFGVDPSIIQQPGVNGFTMSPYQIGPLGLPMAHSQSSAISPSTSHNSSQASQIWNVSNSSGNSPYPYPLNYPSPHHNNSRGVSVQSSRHSQGSPRFEEDEIEGRERTQCPYPECGKSFKDLKAHILTHQNERPEKCPITSCEFHKRGFARKYDRNRHLVTTHYKATIVCGFCPGSGSSAEKSFNRTDVFKRHLVSVHQVEQTPSNSKKKTTPRSSARQSPALPEDATGKCSTCGQIFATPQELFEHFDDCVLRVVTQTDPAEEANEKNLRSIAEDSEVKATLDRHSLTADMESSPSSANGDANEDSEEFDESSNPRPARSGKGAIGSSKSQSGSSLHTVTDGHVTKNTWGKGSGKGRAGVTYSKGGVSLSVGKGRKKKKYYPQSWGCPTDNMKLKKRVLCVFDGQRRLWKDDMMMGDDFEVRMKLPNAEGDSYVTDLDVETMKRAEGFHNASEEERGPWIPSNYSGELSAQLFQEHQLQQQQQQFQLHQAHPHHRQ